MFILCGDRVLGEEFGQDLDNLTAVKHALGAEIASGGGRGLKHKNVCPGNILDMGISLDRVGISLG